MQNIVSIRRVIWIALSIAAIGCDNSDNASFYISDNIVGEKEDQGCSYSSGGVPLLRGILDVGVTNTYDVFPLFVNRIVTRTSTVRADPNGVSVQEAEIELRREDGTPFSFTGLPNPFTVQTSAFVPSARDSATPGQQVGDVRAIPAAYAAQIGSTGSLEISMKAFGRTNGDIDIHTDEWSFIIDLCTGCLVQCLTNATDTEEFACQVGQDFVSKVRGRLGCP